MNNPKPRLSPAHVTGAAALVIGAVVSFIEPWLSALVFLLFVVLCVSACFFPQFNFFGPVISRGRTGRRCVAVTFDDGPSPLTTKLVCDLLDRHQARATFFVSGVNAQKHPEIVADILARGHGIGNHSYSHFPFLMLKSGKTLYREIAEAQMMLSALGVQTRAFRPPVGIINPRLHPVLNKLDMVCVTFSCRARDAGNRRIQHLSARILKKVKADDIIVLHDVPARNDDGNRKLLQELEKIFIGLGKKGLQVVGLEELIGQDLLTRPLVDGKPEING